MPNAGFLHHRCVSPWPGAPAQKDATSKNATRSPRCRLQVGKGTTVLPACRWESEPQVSSSQSEAYRPSLASRLLAPRKEEVQ